MDDAHATRMVLRSGRPEPIELAPEAGLRLMGIAAAAVEAYPAAPPRGAARGGRPRPFARIAVLDSLEAAADAWRLLEALAPASPYQTLAWARAWMASEGAASGAGARIAVAFDERGQPVALLPFVLTRRGPLVVAGFLGGRHTNYHLGLFDPSTAWTAGDVRRLLRRVAHRAGRIDVFALVNQPVEWEGWRNPLARLPHQPSPSDGHSAVLEADGESFLKRHLSGHARKKLRQKTRQLAALGPIRHRVARAAAEIDTVLDAYMAQKAAKLRVIGVRADEATGAVARDLYARAAMGPDPALELHALVCGERIVATFGGLNHRGRFSGQLISHDEDPRFAALSPGEILLTEVVAAKCAAGFARFDLGIGEARYKESLCPVVDSLVDSLVPATLAGRAYVAAEGLRLRVKGTIKRSAWAWPLALAARRRLAALRRGSA